jgi:starch synthase
VKPNRASERGSQRLQGVWHVTREYAGLAEAGGVKDVVRGLADALVRQGVPTTVVLPLYGFLGRELRGRPVVSFTVSLPDQDKENQFFEEQGEVFESELEGVRILFVRSPRFSALRDVYTYTAQDEAENQWKKKGTGHWDAHQLNMVLQTAALESAVRLGPSRLLFHCHDGQTAFLPALMRELPGYAGSLKETASVVTIHNAGKGYHQEVWSPEFAGLLTGLPQAVLQKGMLSGTVDPLLLAGSYSFLCTVSEQYARELLAEKDSEVSGGLGKACRERGIALCGITNGIDPAPWDPRPGARSGLPFAFDPSQGDLAGKRKCRSELAQRLGFSAASPQEKLPLYAFVGRLTDQKGVGVLFSALEKVLSDEDSPAVVILGSGEKHREDMFQQLAARSESRGRLCFVPRYDPALAKIIYAASDFFLIPSEYEPCGLTDFIAQLLGSIPIVHRVGGLVKVRDGETGFSYDEQSPAALAAVIDRTRGLFFSDQARLDAIRRKAFSEIFSLHTWDRVLQDGYLPLYEKALEGSAWTRR